MGSEHQSFQRSAAARTVFRRESNCWDKGCDCRTLSSPQTWERALRPALLEAAIHFRPVHHLPPFLQVVAAAVLVFQVVSVLPHVVAQRRVGARLLLEIPEPPRRLPEGMVEGGELGGSEQPLPAEPDITSVPKSAVIRKGAAIGVH